MKKGQGMQVESRVAMIIGSHRVNSQSAKVGRYIEQQISTSHKDWATVTIDLAELQLPIWDEEHPSGTSKYADLWQPISNNLKECDAVIIVVPEWNGMATPAIKNFFLLCDKDELAHKPGLIVSTSSGQGGAYPISELRMSSYKNTRICYIPDHLIVRNVSWVLNSPDGALSEEDCNIRERIHYSVNVLREYARALAAMRSSSTILPARFQFGM